MGAQIGGSGSGGPPGRPEFHELLQQQVQLFGEFVFSVIWDPLFLNPTPAQS